MKEWRKRGSCTVVSQSRLSTSEMDLAHHSSLRRSSARSFSLSRATSVASSRFVTPFSRRKVMLGKDRIERIELDK
jgi:hypothetical protein